MILFLAVNQLDHYLDPYFLQMSLSTAKCLLRVPLSLLFFIISPAARVPFHWLFFWQTFVVDKLFMVPDPEGKYEALDKYGNDLTELARRGKLDPVIGRDDEIRRCIQILSRRTKNNPVIIGEPGVGKTAIAEGYHRKHLSNVKFLEKFLLFFKYLFPCLG